MQVETLSPEVASSSTDNGWGVDFGRNPSFGMEVTFDTDTHQLVSSQTLPKPKDSSIRELSDPVILQYWECDALMTPSSDVLHHEFGSPAQDFGDQLIELMRRGNGGLGIAANQVGVLRRIAVVTIQGEPRMICNPTMEILGSAVSTLKEGCLSVPGVYESVTRPDMISLSYQDTQGKPVRVRLRGLEAHVVQHELDHLDGVMFFSDKNMTPSRSKSVLRRWKERKKHLPLSVRKASR